MKIIKITDDHYVVVDDSEIKEGDSFYSVRNLIEKAIINYPSGEHIGKITHSTQPLELVDWENGAKGKRPAFDKIKEIPLSEVKELIGEVDVEKKAESYAKDGLVLDTPYANVLFYGYIKGYTQALEDNKEKKYTEEDLGLFLEYVRDNYTGMGAPHLVHNKGGQRKTKAIVQDYIQSLKPKTEWEVEIVDGKLKLK